MEKAFMKTARFNPMPLLALLPAASALGQDAPYIARFSGSVWGLSADGTVGAGRTPAALAMRWTRATGVTVLNAPRPATFGENVSWGGRVICGRYGVAGEQRACYWDENNVFHDIGDLPGGLETAEATATTADGRTVFCTGRDGTGAYWCQWNTETGLVPIPGGFGSPIGCSYDGSVVVGSGDPTSNALSSMIWTRASGFRLLGLLPGARNTGGTAWGCSADGRVVIGSSDSGHGSEAFVWTEAGGLAGLGFLPGGSTSRARRISADGRIIVGGATTSGTADEQAMIWDAHHGMRKLQDVVIEQMNIDPGVLTLATALSADGRSIGGNGYVVRLAAPCAGDVDDGSGAGGRDGQVSFEDLTFFLQHLSAGDMLVDIDDGSGTGRPDGAVTIDDLLYFLNGYEGGC